MTCSSHNFVCASDTETALSECTPPLGKGHVIDNSDSHCITIGVPKLDPQGLHTTGDLRPLQGTPVQSISVVVPDSASQWEDSSRKAMSSHQPGISPTSPQASAPCLCVLFISFMYACIASARTWVEGPLHKCPPSRMHAGGSASQLRQQRWDSGSGDIGPKFPWIADWWNSEVNWDSTRGKIGRKRRPVPRGKNVSCRWKKSGKDHESKGVVGIECSYKRRQSSVCGKQ